LVVARRDCSVVSKLRSSPDRVGKNGLIFAS
jgi:hypothetical protein